MTKRELLLIMLAAGNGRPYTPAQLQKAIFLVTRNLPDVIDQGPTFEFVPYDYGPFDAGVYAEATNLERSGLAVIAPSGSGPWNTYAASEDGLGQGISLLQRLRPEVSEYISKVSAWVRAQSFSGLVRSIYEAYPDMKVNSIFRG